MNLLEGRWYLEVPLADSRRKRGSPRSFQASRRGEARARPSLRTLLGEAWAEPARRLVRGVVLATFFSMAVGAPGGVDMASAGQRASSATRLLSQEEGQAIVDALPTRDGWLRRKPDCSHLVHEVYGLAGFSYPYTPSFGLYSGIEAFARVKKPQPGDLIVWYGHVGIVVSPEARSFYSSLGSGVGIDFYDSRYWVRRGQPRFYRYVARPGSGILTAAERGPTPATREGPRAITAPEIADQRDAPRPAPEGAASPELQPPNATAQGESSQIPGSILIVTRGKQPTRDEIQEAMSELSNAAEGLLRDGKIAKPAMPVVVFDQLRIGRVKVKGGHGRAQVSVDSLALVDGERVTPRRRSEKSSCELRRTSSGWLVLAPSGRLYVPRQVAVRAFADRLAALTRSDASAPEHATSVREQARLARALNSLFQNQQD